MRALRDAIPRERRAEMSAAIRDRLLDEIRSRGARAVFVFRSFGSEVDTHGLIERVAGEGGRVLLPVLQDGALEAARWTPGEPLVRSGYGALEPAEREIVQPAEVDLVVVPGLAFDLRGYRVGYGRGYYDGYLRRLPPGAARIGAAFAAQVVDHVPHGASDEPVDAIVTEAALLAAAGPSR
jgi:5-formyltetrahydrofolate cyclo-ligase